VITDLRRAIRKIIEARFPDFIDKSQKLSRIGNMMSKKLMNTSLADIRCILGNIFMGRYPNLFFGFFGIRWEFRRKFVNPKTDLVIEGYPRSANSFALHAFRAGQQEPFSVAHHLHIPAQIIRAAYWNIPTLVLIRNPQDAIQSLVVRHPDLSPNVALRYYLSFYESIKKYRRSYVLAKFEEVTSDFGLVIEKINEKFGTEFLPFVHTEDNVKEIFNRLDEVNRTLGKGLEMQTPIPSNMKNNLKRAAKKRLHEKKSRQLLIKADSLYDKYIYDEE
jgi:hypothetical protein